ncbi:MAG: hypothetical protein WD066_04345 [Planctomycetaceae bacterium]
MRHNAASIASAIISLSLVSIARADDLSVADIRAVHRHGQTFVTWRDGAEGEAGANYRYALYRSDRPITRENLAQAECCARGILNNSAKLFGSAFFMQDRLDPEKPYSVIEEGAEPLPPWSGLAVHTAREPARAYYAVVVTDADHKPLGRVVPGRSATIEPVEEQPAPIRPIKIHDSTERAAAARTSITGARGLPMQITLHGSSGRGGDAGATGDCYLYFGNRDLGYRDGLPGVFSVSEFRGNPENRLLLRPRDALEHPNGNRAMETYWFGYWCVPQWADHQDSRVYPFTENQLLWMIRWSIEKYGADPQRITMRGSSSGGVGSWNVGLRHPELFAAIYPVVGRVRRVPAVALEGRLDRNAPAVMADGTTSYHDHVDGPRFVAGHPGDLPFVGWCCGRHDGWTTWPENIDMVQALTAGHHGFAFSWNNGNHGGGGAAGRLITQYYPPEKFARDRGYPTFGNSSIDGDMGNGDPADGDLVGGINLGFDWKDVSETDYEWQATLSNELAEAEMTVDVTPRRCAKFHPSPGEKVTWTNTAGGSGEATTDPHGLITIPAVRIAPKEGTTLTIVRRK